MKCPALPTFAEAPMNERWRITWHRYLHVDDGVAGNDDREFAYGWIASKTASDPLLLADAPEQKAVSVQEDTTKMLLRKLTMMPSLVNRKVNVQSLHPDLARSLVLSEPGMQAFGGKLYVSLVSAHPEFGNDVILLSSTSTGSWSYVSTLLTPEDAAGLNAAWTNFFCY